MHIVDLADGIDSRVVLPYAEPKSMGKEHTFQQDTADFDYLKDVLRLIAKNLSLKIRLDGIFAKTVTLKVKYANMKQITRSKSGAAVFRAVDIYHTAAAMLDTVDKRPIRLVGITLSGFTDSDMKQLTLDDMERLGENRRREALDDALLALQRKYGGGIIKTGDEMIAEKRFATKDEPGE